MCHRGGMGGMWNDAVPQFQMNGLPPVTAAVVPDV
jgi:hypothetical protein